MFIILSAIVDSFERATGKRVAYCRNCNRRVSWGIAANPPRVCRKCGMAFKWDQVNKREIRVCPMCQNNYDLDDENCGEHIPAVKLEKGYE
jgi:hypothetical protein